MVAYYFIRMRKEILNIYKIYKSMSSNFPLKYIYFTEEFKKDISDITKSIEISSFRIGEYISDVPREEQLENGSYSGVRYLNYEYMSSFVELPNGKKVSDKVHPSISENPYTLEGVYDDKNELLHILINPKINGSVDENIYRSDLYKIIYVLYSDILTGIERLAFIIYNEDTEINSPTVELNSLDLSKYNNLVTIKIPFKCEISTYMDEDTSHLEGPGVSYESYYFTDKDNFDKFYIGKNSYIRHYLNSINSRYPLIGGITINEFGLKLY